jgi:uncharacterized protein YrrD
MDISMNAQVICVDGPIGKTSHIILNPQTDTVTHLIVAEKDFPYQERLVPVDFIMESTPEHIQLRCTKKQFGDFQTFLDTEFIPTSLAGPYGASYMLWPYTAPESDVITIRHEHTPPGELAIRRGLPVIAADGPVGRVDDFLIDPQNQSITHLILVEGHLWGKKDVTIPVDQIKDIEEDAVHLKLSKAEVGALPTIPLRERYQSIDH